MKAYLTISLFVCSLAMLKASPDQYQLSVSEDAVDLIRVEAEINAEGNELYMSPYGPVPERWPKFIRNLVVTDMQGELIPVQWVDSVKWIMEGVGQGQPLKIRYEVALKHEEQEWPGGIDGVAFTRPWGTMASGRALFVMNGTGKKDIQVRFAVPEAWRVSAPWTATANGYRVQNQEQLQESLIFMGTHREINIEREGFLLRFVLGGQQIVEQETRYTEMAQQLLDYYIELMGGLPKPAPGNRLSPAMVLINQSEQVDGEVIGNHISMLINPDADSQMQLQGWFMFAHEFFHLWNGKSLRFSGTEMDWFKEGITNYYTLKALNQIGFANEPAVRGILNGLFYQRYINDPGFGELSPSEAAGPFQKDNHWGLVYGGGLFAGICLDLELRHRSDNKHSLDDIMRQFYQDFGGTERLISSQDLLNAAENLGSQDFKAVWESSVQGRKAVPLGTFTPYAGQRTDTTGGQLKLIPADQPTSVQQAIWEGFLGAN